MAEREAKFKAPDVAQGHFFFSLFRRSIEEERLLDVFHRVGGDSIG